MFFFLFLEVRSRKEEILEKFKGKVKIKKKAPSPTKEIASREQPKAHSSENADQRLVSKDISSVSVIPKTNQDSSTKIILKQSVAVPSTSKIIPINTTKAHQSRKYTYICFSF